jgi:UDP:flavonoid glycosyltransferase YjiC (YdhE family)
MQILFVSNPLRGHLNTLLPFALAAQRTGHQVVFASGPDMQQLIECRGLVAWPVGPTHAQLGGNRQASWLDYFGRSAAARAVDLLPRASECRPDVVIHEDTDFAGALVAVRSGAQHVVHGLGLMPAVEVWAAFSGRIDQLGREFRVADLAERLRRALYLNVCPPTLQRQGERVWQRSLPLRHCVGMPTQNERLPEALDALPYRETIHLTLGTVFYEASDVLLTAIAGLSELPFNLVATIGPGAERASFGAQPAHVLLAPYLPHALLLPRCRLVVSHGGAGAMLGALTHGLPQVLLPQGGDQFANARACEHAGVAVVLSQQQMSPPSVRNAVRRLLSEPSFTLAAHAVQAEIAAMPSAELLLPKLMPPVARVSDFVDQ